VIVSLESQIATVRHKVAEAARECGRSPDEVTIVAVSKTFPREDVDAAYAAGLRVFGENRVQEAIAKFASPLPSDSSLHLIGQLQTNKVKPALATFDCIESVDRVSLIDALEKEAVRRDIVVSVLLQVNVAREEQKRIEQASHLRCDGFMTIAPLVADPELARPTFAGLRELRDRLGGAARFPILSMGMSNDFAVGISEGATHVRLGRAIFGSRG
jgi:pyridoxal phosphate enzyme (YggS family)